MAGPSIRGDATFPGVPNGNADRLLYVEVPSQFVDPAALTGTDITDSTAGPVNRSETVTQKESA